MTQVDAYRTKLEGYMKKLDGYKTVFRSYASMGYLKFMVKWSMCKWIIT